MEKSGFRRSDATATARPKPAPARLRPIIPSFGWIDQTRSALRFGANSPGPAAQFSGLTFAGSGGGVAPSDFAVSPAASLAFCLASSSVSIFL